MPKIYSDIVTGNVTPLEDSTYDIGTDSIRVRNIYGDTLYGDGSNLTGISGGGGGNAKHAIFIDILDETTDLSVGNAKKTFRLPYAFNVSEIRVSVNTAPIGSSIIVDINKNGTSIFNTKASIDSTEETSVTSSAAYNIKTPFLASDDEITIDIDQVGSGTTGKGLKLLIIGTEITAATALYHLTSNASTVDEGSSVVFTMQTLNVANNTTIGYAITGIASGDISESLTGNFTIQNDTASLTINAVADMSSESSETMTLTAQALTAQVAIVNVDPTYAIARSAASIVEGTSVIFTLNTAGVPNGTTTAYTITGISAGDITGSLTGNFTTQNNAATLTVTAVSDDTTEAGGETMTITAGGATQTCDITDPPTGAPYDHSLKFDGVNDYYKTIGDNFDQYNTPSTVSTSDINYLTEAIRTGKNFSFVIDFRYDLNATPNGDCLMWNFYNHTNSPAHWGNWQNHRKISIYVYSYGNKFLFQLWHWAPNNPQSSTQTKFGYNSYYCPAINGQWNHFTGVSTTNGSQGVWHQAIITRGDSDDHRDTRADGGWGAFLNGEEGNFTGNYSGFNTAGDFNNGWGEATHDLNHSSNDILHQVGTPDLIKTQIFQANNVSHTTLGMIAFYDDVLTPTEIADIYDGGAKAGGNPDQAEIMNQDLTGKSSSGNLRHYWYLDADSSGYSLDFDGTNDWVTMGDATILDGSNTFTISTWIKFDTLPASGYRAVVVSKDEAYELYVRNYSNDIKIYLRLNNGTVDLTGATGMVVDTWYHLVAVHNSGGTDIYLDGVAVSTGLGSQVTINNTADSLVLGSREAVGTNYAFNGLIDEVAIFNAALDANAISAIYNSGEPTDLSSESDLVGYWRMGDGATYPTIPDDSSNSNDGTMTNMTSGDIQTDTPSNDDTGTVLKDKVGGCDLGIWNTTIETVKHITNPQLPYFDPGVPPPSVYNGESTTITQAGSTATSTVQWYSDSNRTNLINTGNTYTYTPSSTGSVTLYLKDTNGTAVQTAEMTYTVSTPGYSTHSLNTNAINEVENTTNVSLTLWDVVGNTYDYLDTTTLPNSGKFSFTFWYCPSQARNNSAYLFYADNNNYIRMNISSYNYPNLQLRLNNTWNNVYGTQGSEGSNVTNWADGVYKWKCYTCTFDPVTGNVKIFTNGEKVADYTSANAQYDFVAQHSGTIKMTLPANNSGSYGRVDNIALYDDVLTDAEAIAVQGGAGTDAVGRSVNLASLSGSSSKLVDYWKIQGDTGTNNYLTGVVNSKKLNVGGAVGGISQFMSTIRP